MTKTDAEIGVCKIMESLFVLQIEEAQNFAMVTKVVKNVCQKPTWELLHGRLGNLGVDAIKKLRKMTTGLQIPANPPVFFCEPCVLAKQTRHVSQISSNREVEALAMVHTDLIGPITPTEYDGSKYCLLLTDDATRVTDGQLFKTKADVEDAIRRYTNRMERQLKRKFQAFRSDNGGEYVSKRLQRWAKEKGIRWEFTVPYNPRQNGVSERANWTILERMQTMLLAANLQKSLLSLAYLWAIQLKNHAPSRSLPEITPAQALYSTVPDLLYLCVFGCTAYVHIPQEKRVKSAKMEPRSQKCQMVGYDGSGIYKVWDGAKVLRTKDDVFDEAQPWTQRIANTTSNPPATEPSLNACPIPLMPHANITSAQDANTPFDVELRAVNEALENDGGDGIDHSHQPQAFIPLSPSPESNFSSPTRSSTSPHESDIEYLPRDSRTRHRPKLSSGFEYTAWLTTAFLSRYEVRVADRNTFHEAMTGPHCKE